MAGALALVLLGVLLPWAWQRDPMAAPLVSGMPQQAPGAPALAVLPSTGAPPAVASLPGPGLNSTPSIAGMPVLASRDEPAPGGLRKRISIVKADFKYPRWRIEETLKPGLAGQPDTLRSRTFMVADHALVRLNDAGEESALRELAGRLGLTLRKAMRMPGCYLVATADPSPDALPNLLTQLNRETGLIRYAEPDFIVHSQDTTPNDPMFTSTWGLRNIGHPGSDISAPKAWDLITGGTQVVVAVIDTGISYTHADLAANIWTNTAESANGADDDGNGFIDDTRGWNFLADNNNPMDDHSHGSHCAGTIGAIGNNATGVAGVNWRCRIMPLKFLDASGSGTDSDAADALHYVAELRRHGVNIRLTSNSWGGGDYNATLREAIAENASLGILFIAAAGNDGLDIDSGGFYPANYAESNMLVIAATDSSDGLASFSNYGATTVHFAAPGVSILSTILNNGYGYKNGTSMATPHVSGVATLLWNAWPSAAAADIRDALIRGIDPVSGLTSKTITGGRLNAFKALKTLFRIAHTPLTDTFNTGTDYAVDADIGPALFYSSNSVSLFWNADGSTNFTEVALTPVSNTLYRAFIPLQPQGATLHYWIRATSTNNTSATSPTNAPATTHQFHIVPSFVLSVSGTPGTIAAVVPTYGTGPCPSGKVFAASAPATTPATNGTRWACAGWIGSGSVPATGSSNAVTFTLNEDSTLTWQWRREFALTHTNAVTATLNRTTWWPEGSAANTLTASVSLTSGTTNLMFTGWSVDGVRQPDAVHTASNPATGITMDQPHLARASYLPETQDATANRLPDWWEFFYFGTNTIDPAADTDSDGFANHDEYLDHTNPHDPESQPEPPAILHTALANPQSYPAPYPITAMITDNCKVVSATLCWSRNDSPIQSNAMTLGSGSIYTATLPAPGTNTDHFSYWITAADLRVTSTNGPHEVTPSYPLAHPSPAVYLPLLLPGTSTNLMLALTNSGTAPLQATIRLLPGGFQSDLESGAENWTNSGAHNLWTLSTNRSVSGSTSWYCGNPATRVYDSNMHACLDTPPVYLPPGAYLSFNHWIKSELDVQFWRPGWLAISCWDGGIVSISTNDGASFATLTPVGGYPNRISGYYASPWPDMTPCFAGTGTWNQAHFDLTAFTGHVAIIRFEFGSDENTEEEGWYIDDIALTPALTPPSWIALAATNLTVPPNDHGAAPALALDTCGIATGDREAALWIASNDPLIPNTSIPIHLRVRSPARLEWLGASQTSTDGCGVVTLANAVSDADGENCALEFQWASETGAPWSNLWLAAVGTSQGSAAYSNGLPLLITSLATQSNGVPVTNLVTATWDTQHPGNGPLCAPGVQVRGRTWDGLFTGNWVTSQPFMVDNEEPPTPTHFVSLVHRTNAWSQNPTMNLRWDGVQEARGSGLANYLLGISTNWPVLTPRTSTTNRSATLPVSTDGTNIWAWVRARDGMGNLSIPASFGPCWIDANPPSATGAVVTLAVSAFGNYLIGTTSVTGLWTGFTDAGAGIAGFYFASTNAGGTSGGTWTTNLQGVLNGLQQNKTNTLYVWAQDRLGWIGTAASASCLVLAKEGDWDHDGVLNLDEDTAGTDALSASSQLHVGITAGNSGMGQAFVIRWPGITNRHYTVFAGSEPSPSPSWYILPGATNLTGFDGTMTFTDRTVVLPTRFYRIRVTAP